MASTTERLRAILVEDESLVALHLEQLLEELGLEIAAVAGRVGEAIQLINTASRLEIAVLDVNLAGELSWPVARACRARGLPFLFVTGYLPSHARLPDDLNDAPVLSKPPEESALRASIERILGRRIPDRDGGPDESISC